MRRDVWHRRARRMARCCMPTNRPAGRGRLTRTWFSPPGNLYLSILLRTDTPPARVGELSFLAALAVAETVEALMPRQISPMLKWPNDVLVNGAKIAGILLEQEQDATILGIGLNVLRSPPNANYKTTTIVDNGGIASVDSARDILLDRLGHHLDVWLADGFAPIRELWLERSYPVGASVRVNAQGEVDRGRVRRPGPGRRPVARHAGGAPAGYRGRREHGSDSELTVESGAGGSLGNARISACSGSAAGGHGRGFEQVRCDPRRCVDARQAHRRSSPLGIADR